MSNPWLRSPADAALAASLLLTLAVLVAVVAASRVRPKRTRPHPGTRASTALLRGVGLVVLSEGYRRVVRDTALSTTYDLRQFAVLDWNPGRLLLQMAPIGVGAAVVLLGVTWLRGRRPGRPGPLVTVAWLVPLVSLQLWRAGTAGLSGGDAGAGLLALACVGGALAGGSLERRVRRGALGWKAAYATLVLGLAAIAI